MWNRGRFVQRMDIHIFILLDILVILNWHDGLFIQHLKDIMKILKCVCFKCSRIKNKQGIACIVKMNARNRWDIVSKMAEKIDRCGNATSDGCGCKQLDK